MFREMRRKKQQLPEAEALQLLQKCDTAVLALHGDDGYPYAVPVNYVFKDGKLYFHSARTGHKLDAIARWEKVSLCVIDHAEVVPETLSTDYRSVIVFGRARLLEGAELDEAILAFGLRFHPDRAHLERELAAERPGLSVVEITPEHITAKVSKSLL